MKIEKLWWIAMGIHALVACTPEPTPVVATQEETAAPACPPATTATGCGPVQALAALDSRQPVPLQPMMAWHQKQNMMQHLVAIQRITAGIAREDWEEITTASALIGTSPQMQQMCEHMGAGAEGFTERALEFHRRADAIGEAARAHDGAAALQATAHTLEACTACHAAYRQDVVDAATWQQRTGQIHDPSVMHQGMMH